VRGANTVEAIATPAFTYVFLGLGVEHTDPDVYSLILTFLAIADIWHANLRGGDPGREGERGRRGLMRRGSAVMDGSMS
jgi:hypothetical protein